MDQGERLILVEKFNKERVANRMASQIATRDLIKTNSLTNAEIGQLVGAYPAYTVGVAYKIGDLVAYKDKLYKCIQAHTSQSDWPPNTTLALWNVIQITAGGTILNWVSGEAVRVGDKRIYNSITYTCLQAHTTQTGWEPPKVPALWVK